MGQTAAQGSMRIYRLGWKGMLYYGAAIIGTDGSDPGCLALPLSLVFWIPAVLLSYLKTSDEGLELHLWPRYRLQVSWQEVERLGTCRILGLLPFDALYLRRPAAKAREAVVREWAVAERCIVPLSDFQGWPDGALAEELQRRLPQLFEAGRAAGATASSGEEA